MSNRVVSAGHGALEHRRSAPRTTRGSSVAAGAAGRARRSSRSRRRAGALGRRRAASVVWHRRRDAGRISRDSIGIALGAPIPSGAGCRRSARARAAASRTRPLLGDPGAAAGEPVAGLVVRPRRRASASSRARSAARLADRRRDVDQADLVQPRRLARDLALGAVEAEPDRAGEGVGRGRLGVLAGARQVALERLDQGSAAKPQQARRGPRPRDPALGPAG